MKTILTIAFLTIISAPLVRSGDVMVPTGRPGEMMDQEIVQKLLSGAVHMAILRQDVEHLKKLRDLGWDPKKPIIEESLIEDKWPTLHAAVLHRSPKVVEWLVTEAGVEKDQRGLHREFAISHDYSGDDEISKSIIALLKRDDDGGIEGLFDALLDEMEPWENHDEKRIIIDATDTPDPELFLKQLRKRCGAAEAVKDRKEILKQLDAAVHGMELITISIKKASDDGYSYSLEWNSGPLSGGGQTGKVFSKHGYWIVELEGGWDS
jgi:hypothetical protein